MPNLNRLHNALLRPIAVILLLTSVPLSCANVNKNKPVGSPEQCWLSVEQVEADRPYEARDDKFEYWAEIMVKCNELFWSHCRVGQQEEVIKHFVAQFGKHGARADMRWLLTEPEVFLAKHYISPAATIPSSKNAVGQKARKRLIQAQLTASESLVRLCLRDGQMLQRYYGALLWSQECFGAPHMHWVTFSAKIGGLREHFKDKGDVNYWWYARDFVLLAHATGRDDLLTDANPEDLLPRFKKWLPWVLQSELRLQPRGQKWVTIQGDIKWKGHVAMSLEQPASPFADWDSHTPPDPDLFQIMLGKLDAIFK